MIERQEGQDGGFRATVVIAVAAVAAVLAAISLYFAVQSGGGNPGARATTSTSFSALGFRAFANLLDELDFAVERNRSAHGARMSASLAILPAPRRPADLGAALHRLQGMQAILIIAPKRVGASSPQPQFRVEATLLVSETTVGRVLREAHPPLSIVRPDGPPGPFSVNRLGVAPSIAQIQLGAGVSAAPVIAYGGADEPLALVAEIRAQAPRIWLLTDPDPLSNHGIHVGDNALFAVRLVEALAQGDRRVVFDEVVGEVAGTPSTFALLFQLPWLALPIALTALVVVIGLTAAQRFGTPKDAIAGVAAGRASLIGATARLQTDRANARAALGRYMRRTLRQVAQRRHAPEGDDAALAHWLDAVAQRDPDTTTAARLLAEALDTAHDHQSSEATILATAKRVHDWRMDMLNEQRERPARPGAGRGR